MVLTWFIGVNEMNLGFTTAARLRAATIPDIASVATHTGTMADIFEYGALYAVRATLSHPRITFPLAIAEAILAGLLIITSGLAMGGRRGSRALALQALLANATLAILAFVLTPFVRGAYIEGVLRAVDTLTLDAPQREALTNVGVYQWAMRFKLVFQLGVLGLGALALTRTRTKTFFEAVARATERTEEP
jgi:hypothetical protein